MSMLTFIYRWILTLNVKKDACNYYRYFRSMTVFPLCVSHTLSFLSIMSLINDSSIKPSLLGINGGFSLCISRMSTRREHRPETADNSMETNFIISVSQENIFYLIVSYYLLFPQGESERQTQGGQGGGEEKEYKNFILDYEIRRATWITIFLVEDQNMQLVGLPYSQ